MDKWTLMDNKDCTRPPAALPWPRKDAVDWRPAGATHNRPWRGNASPTGARQGRHITVDERIQVDNKD